MRMIMVRPLYERLNETVRTDVAVRVDGEDKSVGLEPGSEVMRTEMFPKTDEASQVDPPDCPSSLPTPDLQHHTARATMVVMSHWEDGPAS